MILFTVNLRLSGQSIEVDSNYQIAFNDISNMLSGAEKPLFKRAVFVTENAFLKNELLYEDFETSINSLTAFAEAWMKTNSLHNYHAHDSSLVHKSGAIYALLKDNIKVKFSNSTVKKHYPFIYDYEDFFGRSQWTKMFVSKLLVTNSGNCHSLPYLYKILADELGIKNAWLSFAPSHIYIKNWCQGIGWYNTELTSGQFPVDAWIMASGYVPTDAVRSGIYMDTLSNLQAIANCALDLAKGYERKFKNYTDSFIIKCCDLTLKYHPVNINAIIYKAEILKKMYLIYQKEDPALADTIYPDMEKLYLQALDLGYKEMPEKMYKEWMLSISKQKNKYTNKKVSDSVYKN